VIAAAARRRERPEETRVLRLSRDARPLELSRSPALARWIERGAVLVLNDAATIPASLHGTNPHGDPVELRLAEAPRFDAPGEDIVRAVLFGAGDFRTPTEERPLPRPLAVGARLHLGPIEATVVRVHEAHQRLLWVSLSATDPGRSLAEALYAHGRPVQYSYVREPLPLWSVQTPFATRPVAVEAPSSGYALSWALVASLREKGVEIASLTHGTGLSSTGDEALDALFPLDERYEIPERTASIVDRASAEGRPIIAVGTGAMRALESAARRSDGPSIRAGLGQTSLRLGPNERARLVTGILTGVHDPSSSHGALLRSLIDDETLSRAALDAERAGLLGHEFGDAMLVV